VFSKGLKHEPPLAPGEREGKSQFDSSQQDIKKLTSREKKKNPRKKGIFGDSTKSGGTEKNQSPDSKWKRALGKKGGFEF